MKENKIISLLDSARAFTLFELMLTIGIFAILVALGYPSIQQSIRNNQVVAQGNELVALLSFARSEAIRRNTSVPILLTPNTDGWSLIVEDPNDEADVVGCVPGQLRCVRNTRVYLIADFTELTFNNRGYITEAAGPWTAETIYLKHESCSGDYQHRRIDITPTGQVRSCSLGCNTAACPP